MIDKLERAHKWLKGLMDINASVMPHKWFKGLMGKTRHEPATNGVITKGPYMGHKRDIKETMGTFLDRAINAPIVPQKGCECIMAKINSAASCGTIKGILPTIEEIELSKKK